MATVKEIEEMMGKWKTDVLDVQVGVWKKSMLDDFNVNYQKLLDTATNVDDKMKIKSDEVNTAVRELEGLKNIVMEKVEEIETKIKEMKGNSGDKEERKKYGMTTNRAFHSLPNYTGKHEDYDEWKFKLKTFLSEDEGIKEVLLKKQNDY